MFVDSIDREEMGDARLAHMHPEAYEAKMKAKTEYNPIRGIINFFKNLLAKKAR